MRNSLGLSTLVFLGINFQSPNAAWHQAKGAPVNGRPTSTLWASTSAWFKQSRNEETGLCSIRIASGPALHAHVHFGVRRSVLTTLSSASPHMWLTHSSVRLSKFHIATIQAVVTMLSLCENRNQMLPLETCEVIACCGRAYLRDDRQFRTGAGVTVPH